MENEKQIDIGMPSEQLEYSTPIFEEQGDLHKLTHGVGTVDFDGGEGGYLNFG